MITSAHTVLRYLERVDGYDVDDLRRRAAAAFPEARGIGDTRLLEFLEQEIAGAVQKARERIEATCRVPASVGASRVALGGMHYILRSGAVVTVAPSPARGRKRPPHRRPDRWDGMEAARR